MHKFCIQNPTLQLTQNIHLILALLPIETKRSFYQQYYLLANYLTIQLIALNICNQLHDYQLTLYLCKTMADQHK